LPLPFLDDFFAIGILLHDKNSLAHRERRRERWLAANRTDPGRAIDRGAKRCRPVFNPLGLEGDDYGIACVVDHAAIELMSLARVG